MCSGPWLANLCRGDGAGVVLPRAADVGGDLRDLGGRQGPTERRHAAAALQDDAEHRLRVRERDERVPVQGGSGASVAAAVLLVTAGAVLQIQRPRRVDLLGAGWFRELRATSDEQRGG